MQGWIRPATMVFTAGVLITSLACDNRADTKAPPAATPPTNAAVPTTDDARLTALIQSKYFGSDQVKVENVDVDTNDGVATLHGTVQSEAAKQEAIRLARSVDGVRDVRDELTIAQATQANAQAVDGAESRTERNPAWITTKIQAQYFASPEVKPWNVDVTTSRSGVVTLAGTVDAEADRREAIRIARTTEGVTDVRDQLRVKEAVATTGTTAAGAAEEGAESLNDSWITAKIQSKYFLNPDVKGRDINVDTNAGVVRLRGSVDSYGERRQAVSLARNTDGVREVRDELRVDRRNQPTAYAGQAASTAVAKTGQAIDDGWVKTKLESKFYTDEQLHASRIDIAVRNGQVTLTGQVPSPDAKQAAAELARDTDGVSGVQNQLTIAPSGGGESK